jgi:hypothetical protein
LLFLGAGASKPLGIPTMPEFTDVIIKDLVSKKMPNWGAMVMDVQERIVKSGLIADIEPILSVLRGIAYPQNTIAYVGAQAILTGDKYSLSGANNIAKVAIEQIEDAIYRKCVGIDHKSAIHLLGRLWDALDANISYPVSRDRIESVGVGPLRKIFTTNYDVGVETFLISRNYGFDDGFHQDTVGDIVFDGRWDASIVNVFKMHGSVNYVAKDGGQIRTYGWAG